MYKNVILAVLGVAVLAGIGFVVAKNNHPDVTLNQGPNENQAPSQQEENNYYSPEFGDARLFHIGQEAERQLTYPDGLKVFLKSIDDSRCPEGVQCIWAGELSYTFTLSKDGKSIGEVRLGTMTAKTATVGEYTFTLKEGKKVEVIISIVKN